MEWMFLPIKRYADFEGRSRRMEFWMFQLGQWIFYIALIILLGVFGAAMDSAGTGVASAFTIPFALVWLGLVIPNLAVTVRRLHDQDKSGWWILLNFIPFGGLVLLIFMFIDGTAGENQYGPSPKEQVTADTFG